MSDRTHHEPDRPRQWSTENPVPVLIVDDNAGKRLALKSVLAPLGYRLVEAESGVAALGCLLKEDFAVILMDVRMPMMDGFETAQLIRQRVRSELTPIIFITAFGKDALADMAAYATGAADFIFSPVPTPELQAKVSVFANIYRRAEVVAAQAQTLQESTDELALLTDTAPIGIFRTSVDGEYVYVNARWTEITGLSSDDVVGRPWSIVLSEESGTEHGPTPFGYVESGDALEPAEFEFGTKTADGSGDRVAQGTVKPLLGRDDLVRGWVGTLSDVTDEVMARQMLLDARDAALATTLMQHNFTASASHELRTPTTAIVGFIEEVLENDEISQGDRACLDIAYRSALRLSALIDDLLILGQEDIGAGRMSLEPTPVGVVVDAVVASFSASAEHADLSLVMDPMPGSDALLALADPLRLEQALDNLLSNALKFTPPGGRIRVRIDAVDDSVLITVEDTGIGIDPESQVSIFDRFYRAQAATESGTKGTGLGLAISLQMIEAQGGRLTVTSEVGTGSTFTITLPRAGDVVAV